MKSTLLPFVTMMTLLFLLPTGCRKDDSVSQPELADEQLMRDFLSDDYFATASEYYNPSPADPSAQTTTESRTKESMTAALKDYFAKNPKEVKKINQKYGYPVWDAIVHADKYGEAIIHLPLADLKKNKIESILTVYQSEGSDKLYFRLLPRDFHKKLKSKRLLPKMIDKQGREVYVDISSELLTAQVAYFEYNLFQSTDCSLMEILREDGIISSELESRSCYTVFYVQETQHWNVFAGGYATYQYSTYSYSSEYKCDNIQDPGMYLGGSGINWANGAGGISNTNDINITLTPCQSNNMALTALVFTLTGSIINKCTGHPLDLNSITTTLCNQNKYTETNFINTVKSTMGTSDYIDDSEIKYDPNLPTTCSKINCLWDRIKNKIGGLTQNSYSCVTDIMDEAINGPMRVGIGYALNSLGSVNAQTVPHSTFGGQTLLFHTRININPDLCQALNNGTKEPMEVVGMFLHEMVHARLYEHLYHNGYNIDNSRVLKDVWDKFVQSKYPGITIAQTQHQLMAQEYVSDIAFALYQLNGNLGTPEDYLIYGWQGLEKAFDATQKATYGFLPTSSQLNAMKNRYISNVRPLEDANKKRAITYSCR